MMMNRDDVITLSNLTLFFLSMVLGLGLSQANEADVADVTVKSLGKNRYKISTTVQHADQGWDHYADAWQVLDQDGNVIGQRTLHHPHVNEQPFTRSLTLTIPESVEVITVRARDSVHGFGGVEKRFELKSRDAEL